MELSLKAAEKGSDPGLWHRRFGHLSLQRLQGIQDATTGFSGKLPTTEEACEPCKLTKSVRVINRKAPERATQVLQRIHSDIWGPYTRPTVYGDFYLVTFTDDYTRKSWVYILKSRDQLRGVFIEFRALV